MRKIYIYSTVLVTALFVLALIAGIVLEKTTSKSGVLRVQYNYTSKMMEVISLGIDEFFTSCDKLPEPDEYINNLLKDGFIEKRYLDAWGNGILMNIQEDDSYSLISIGPDGVPDTKDDLTTNYRVGKPAT